VRHPQIEAILFQPLHEAQEVGIDADRPFLDLPPHTVVVVEYRPHAGKLPFLVTLVDRERGVRRVAISPACFPTVADAISFV
jgi:hypothetical protein